MTYWFMEAIGIYIVIIGNTEIKLKNLRSPSFKTVFCEVNSRNYNDYNLIEKVVNLIQYI
jgi:hypothetical protein